MSQFLEEQMATATARVVVLMPPEEKAKLTANAEAAGITVGEYVRRSVATYEAENDNQNELVEELLGVLAESQQAAISAIERAEKAIKETESYLDERQ